MTFLIPKRILIERKYKIKQIFVGYKFQLYAQNVLSKRNELQSKKMFLHSLSDNKRYEIPFPNKKELLEFEKLIKTMKEYKPKFKKLMIINAKTVFINHYVTKIMMSLPDFKEKQTLFISTNESDINKIRFLNDNICFTIDDQIENQISCHKIFALFIIGDCSLTTPLIRNAQKYGISIFLMNRNFQAYASLISKAEGNYLLRQKQYQASEQEEFKKAQKLMSNKIQNQITLLRSINLESKNLTKLEQK